MVREKKNHPAQTDRVAALLDSLTKRLTNQPDRPLATEEICNLARQPEFLDKITQMLPELWEGQTLNAAWLYQTYTDLWLEQEGVQGHTLLTPDDRRLLAEELAVEMLRTGEPAIHYSRIPARVKAHFQLERVEEIDHFEADIRTCNFLSRDDAGNYAFTHKSFIEFFAASRLHQLMLEDHATAGGLVCIDKKVRLFLTDLFALEPKPEPGPPYTPPEGFVWVPPGEFILGGKDGLPLQIARLEAGFFAARTPVTNEQYARFVAKTGHEPPEHWRGPRPSDGLANHPVVNVSWYDAEVYCQWLTEQLPVADPELQVWHTGKSEMVTVRLPTEQEWEKATRGYDGREYPWGEWAEERCNTEESGIGKTSPVGQFSPAGDSPYGLQDAAGNVREWTASEWEAGDFRRVLRSGSFIYFRHSARCTYREKFFPNLPWYIYGFRIVVSPIPPASALRHSVLCIAAEMAQGEEEEVNCRLSVNQPV